MSTSRQLVPALVLVVLAVLTALAVPDLAAASGTADPTPTTGPTEPSPSTTPTEAASPTVEPSPTQDPTTPPPGPTTISGAQLRWGVNDESNNRAFAPGTFNFLSAGKVPDPGSGGNTVRNGTWSNTGAQAWSAAAGNVRIEKRTPSGTYVPASFTGLSTQADGTALGGPTSGTSSGHQVVVDGGTGVVDPAAGTATVQWQGTFTVLYYSGMSFFTVTAPRLVVTPTSAVLRGTIGGYASDMADTSTWTEVAPLEVTLADLPRSALVLDSAGFSLAPAYAGVTYSHTGDQVAQVRSGPSWGAFPQTFVDGLQRAGSAAYFYSSGGSADASKVARPITVSFSAATPVAPIDLAAPIRQAGQTTTSTTSKTAEVRQPPALEPPDPSNASTASTGSAAGSSTTADGAAAAAPRTDVPPAAGAPTPGLPAYAPVGSVPAVHALTSAVVADPDPDHRWQWWLGALLLLGAAGTTLITRLEGHP